MFSTPFLDGCASATIVCGASIPSSIVSWLANARHQKYYRVTTEMNFSMDNVNFGHEILHIIQFKWALKQELTVTNGRKETKILTSCSIQLRHEYDVNAALMNERMARIEDCGVSKLFQDKQFIVKYSWTCRDKQYWLNHMISILSEAICEQLTERGQCLIFENSMAWLIDHWWGPSNSGYWVWALTPVRQRYPN
jgi:hypothetical protein